MTLRVGFRRSGPHGCVRIDEAPVATVEAVICAMEPVRLEVLLLHRIKRLSYAGTGERLSLSRAEVKTHIAGAVAELVIGLTRKQRHDCLAAECPPKRQD